ncbi:hypothetical protein ACFOKI_07405 [Sphingomonas qilianensis]|uniref:Uncharacterized protein n=1 Tax=Sphingomonas qilianensis TaxID=1736690 RepID=A0ABU9XTW6_9SPHN
MRGKPSFIVALREFTLLNEADAPGPAKVLLERIEAYRKNDMLGGPECAAMIQAMAVLQKALGLRKLPDELTETAWCFVTF